MQKKSQFREHLQEASEWITECYIQMKCRGERKTKKSGSFLQILPSSYLRVNLRIRQVIENHDITFFFLDNLDLFKEAINQLGLWSIIFVI